MRTVSIDPHVHSTGSFDATASVPDPLTAASDAGLDVIVVTDHDRIEHSLWAAELTPEYGLVGIPGVEVSTAVPSADARSPGRFGRFARSVERLSSPIRSSGAATASVGDTSQRLESVRTP